MVQKRWIKRTVGKSEIYYDRTSGAIHTYPPHDMERDEVWVPPESHPLAPLRLYYDPTYRCNLSCRHCITRSSPTADASGELTLNQACTLLSECARAGILDVAVTGGEPFVYQEIFPLIAQIRNCGMNVMISTNGLLVSEKVAARLARLGVLDVRVSFEGAEEINDNVRGKGTYQKALRAVNNLIKTGNHTVVRLTLSGRSEDHLEDLFADLASAGVHEVKASAIKEVGRAADPENADLLGYTADLESAQRLQDLGALFGIEVQLSSDDFPLTPREANDHKLRFDEGANCGAGFATAYVSPYGEVLPCSSMPHVSFGNVASERFMEIWTGERARRFRELVATCGTQLICKAPCFSAENLDLAMRPRSGTFSQSSSKMANKP
ncbi:radical SAM protein with 4Fe4S-binding SPASM domain [Methanofollis sp. W23]|uniref:radical SAM protein n=1 Tax=Methanofollis sp. W23 TaxID=2817849 RepID=UPI001AEA9540|nr:radical SAM protein [Methanofollis sp. W23]MBP2144781.1 radical SAM protein with 4Fe4S-binding SPASM domain [Methanofollis sp. W23]